jgi:hypothetical protein
MNLKSIKEELKTRTIQAVADSLGLQVVDLRYLLKLNGLTSFEIKADHARFTLAKLAGNHTVLEMAAISGFSPRKVTHVLRRNNLKSKFSK